MEWPVAMDKSMKMMPWVDGQTHAIGKKSGVWGRGEGECSKKLNRWAGQAADCSKRR